MAMRTTTGTVPSSGRGGTAAATAQNEMGGRAFHARAAATGKARSPSVVRPVDGMTSVDVEALRRRRRDPTSAVKWRVSARYDGAVPLGPSMLT